VEASASSGGAAHSNPTNGDIDIVVRKTRTATEDLRRQKYLKNARRQTSIRLNTIISCAGPETPHDLQLGYE
jgi:hypothetical protein